MMKRLATAVGVLILVLTGCRSMVSGPKLVLVENGRPLARIVLAADAPEEVRRAADELRDCVRTMSGAELPIVTADGGPAGIFLGAAAGLDTAGCTPDGCRVTVDSQSLRLAGPTPVGTEFGVYGVLQDLFGVRWYLPGPHGTYVPRRPTVAVAAMDTIVNPAFLSRAYSAPTFWEGTTFFQPAKAMDQAWYRHNRMLERLHCSHNLGRVIVPSKYGKDHPEYFPFRAGERRVPATDRPVAWQPCMTNPEVVALCAEAAAKFFDDNPETLALSFSIGVNDSGGYCECPACLEANGGPPTPNSRGLPDFSQLAFKFGNAVAAALPERHRDKYVGMIAYANIRDYPEGVPIHPNLTVQRVTACVCYFNPDDRKDLADTARFARDCRMFSVYDYQYGSGYTIPVLPLGLLDRYLDFLADRDCRGWNAETYQNWAVDGIKYYLLSRKLWYPDLHFDNLLDEFCTDMFGDGARDMRAFYRLCQRRWETQKGPTTKYHLKGSIKQTLVFDVPTCEKLLVRIDAARAKCAGTDGLALLGYQRTAIEMALANARKVAVDHAIATATDDADLARLALASLVQAQCFDAARARLRRDAFSLPRNSFGEAMGMPPETAATALYRRGRPDLWQRFLAAVEAQVPDQLPAVAWLDHLPETADQPEILANADFAAGLAKWTAVDWGSEDVKSEIALETGPDGIPFCRLEGLAHCFMYAPSPGIDQFVDFAPGQWYVCEFETRATGGDLVAPTATVYFPRNHAECTIPAGPEWQPAVWLFQAPDKAGNTRVRFATNGLGRADFRKLSIRPVPAAIAPAVVPNEVGRIMPPLDPPAVLPPPTLIDLGPDGQLVAADGYAVRTVFHAYAAAYDLEISLDAASDDGARFGLVAFAEARNRSLARDSLVWNRKLSATPETLTFRYPFPAAAYVLRLILYRTNQQGTLRLANLRLTPATME